MNQKRVIADSGSTVTLLDNNTFNEMGRPQLKPTSINVFTFNSAQPLQIQGKMNVNITYNNYTVAAVAFFPWEQRKPIERQSSIRIKAIPHGQHSHQPTRRA